MDSNISNFNMIATVLQCLESNWKWWHPTGTYLGSPGKVTGQSEFDLEPEQAILIQKQHLMAPGTVPGFLTDLWFGLFPGNPDTCMFPDESMSDLLQLLKVVEMPGQITGFSSYVALSLTFFHSYVLGRFFRRL